MQQVADAAATVDPFVLTACPTSSVDGTGIKSRPDEFGSSHMTSRPAFVSFLS